MKRSSSAPWADTVDAFEHVAAEAVLRRDAQSPSAPLPCKALRPKGQEFDLLASGADG